MSKPSASKPRGVWWLYLLECAGNKLYAGISPDPQARFALHLAGRGAKFTRAYPPRRILAAQAYPGRAAASSAEHALKKLRRPAKLLWASQRAWPPVEAKVSARGSSRKRSASAAK